ncbi:MAG: histone deacetylase [Pseudanabaena sp.]|nr:MAG: histone deacetylase [Pseudanabaena sp.]
MTPIIYSEEFAKHFTGEAHPERAERIVATFNALRKTSWADKIQWLEPSSMETPLVLSLIHEVHIPEYVQAVEEFANNNGQHADNDIPTNIQVTEIGGFRIVDGQYQYFDADVSVCRDSYNVALLAVRAWMDGVDLAISNGRPAFVLARPPGHHALSNRGMGFCLFGNAAIAANYALKQSEINRVGILDWDIHHGNGTQALVENNPDIAFCSLHEMQCYPNTGYPSEKGKYDNVLNIPILAGSKLARYEQAFETEVLPFFTKFQPDLLIVSAGYDANLADPLSEVCLQPSDYGKLTQYCLQLTNKIVFGLEGGYAVKELTESVVATIEQLNM